MNISANSKKGNNIFVSLNNKYIDDAINNGFKKIIVSKSKFKAVKSTRKYLEKYLKKYYYKQIKDVILIGVTGTNGKTSTSYLIYQALNLAGIKCSYIGTIGFYLENDIKKLNNTTPDICDLYEMIIESINCGCKAVVMEVSSHALKLGRVNTLKFDYAILTNITEDHLDFHKTYKDYYKTKMSIFKKLKKKGTKISDIKIENYDINNDYFKYNNKIYNTKIKGEYNIKNIIPSIIILDKMNIDSRKIIPQLCLPPGRMQIIKFKNNSIIIDYAHTPDAMEKIISTVKIMNHNRIITIFGCGGNREKEKRPKMGEIASLLSDYVILTNDNPRDENPKEIIREIKQNMNNNYKIIYDRKKAIQEGIKMLKENDILLILGKGHEEYQVIDNKKIFFSDLYTVYDII
ncbi:MAG: UDP-N-acetylmuramoyl-L-alanyl-D-glutamate--2,6-diaminopimelate ligase [Bacilli bacterium]|nr:UDP-N-acetylmuramoyl-L-alanyl-D-glutamate--2,6-diaminopimelate ligase [Bacilli bacterium]